MKSDRMMRCGPLFVLVLLMALCIVPYSMAQEDELPTELTIFLYDRCGACGSNGPECGECKDTLRMHDMVKRKLGDRLYDGTIRYRILNCRMDANRALYEQMCDAFGVDAESRSALPITFLGDASRGVYMVSEPMLEHVAEMLDRLVLSEDVQSLQLEINTRSGL